MDPGVLDELEKSLSDLDRVNATRIVKETPGLTTPLERVELLIMPVLERIGTRWDEGELSLSQVYMGGKICEEIVDSLLPPGNPGRKDLPRMAVAVFRDHHSLGKRIVYFSLRAAGFDPIDYGQGLSSEEIVGRAIPDGIDILILSTLMLNSALHIRELTTVLKKERPGMRIIVGGAPFNFDPLLWKEVGADAMGHSASDVVSLVQAQVQELSA